jgi:hypothetical protein
MHEVQNPKDESVALFVRVPRRLRDAVAATAVKDSNGFAATLRTLLSKGLEVDRQERQRRG